MGGEVDEKQRRLQELHSAVNMQAFGTSENTNSSNLAVYFAGSLFVILLLFLLPADTSKLGNEKTVLEKISAAALARPLVRSLPSLPANDFRS